MVIPQSPMVNIISDNKYLEKPAKEIRVYVSTGHEDIV